MTKGEAKKLETDVVIFPVEFDRKNKEETLVEESSAKVVKDKA